MNDADRQTSLRNSYQLHAASILQQYPSLSSYFSLKAVDSKSNLSFNTNLTPNVENTCGDVNINANRDKQNHAQRASFNPFSNLGSEFLCPHCGLHLSPGHFQTNVRLRALHRGSTRRRRASRNQSFSMCKSNNSTNPRSARKKHNTKEWKSVSSFSSSKENGPNHYEKEIYEVNKKLEYQLKRVTDGEAKNCIVYTCGRCGAKLKYKGVTFATKNKQKEQIRNDKCEQKEYKKKFTTPSSKRKLQKDERSSFFHLQPLQIKQISSTTQLKQRSEQKEKQKILGGAFIGHSFASKNSNMKTPSLTTNSNQLSGNFIPLSSKSKSKNVFSSPLLQSKKKKSKRGKSDGNRSDDKGKKSQLMNFLASLND